MLRGVCDKGRLLDLMENFSVFSERRSEVVRILTQNHQFLGVNAVLSALEAGKRAVGQRLGVFWHTQGSGKSFSMVFFSQKVLRKIPGNWTFVIVTDREDLDAQIYKTFVGCGAVPPLGRRDQGDGEHGVRARSGEHLQRLLREDHRYVFTLIQKFRTDVKGAVYPKLSDRRDIIVIADEAHRSQYDTFAQNLRSALPNAAFIGFTGTPLMAGEEKTREVFGDYVSVYNFRQAVEDNATVPLFYEARIPELQLTNEDFDAELCELLDDADLDEDERRKVGWELSKPYQILTRERRLDEIAGDLVTHLVELPPGTKAMVVAIDKVTAVRMYNKVKVAWGAKQAELLEELHRAPREEVKARQALIDTRQYMAETDMAVVVSQEQNEIDRFKKRGLDIAPHRLRMVKEDLDTKFKDGGDPLRIVFVCAMWMTGFDVPSCGVIYLDKPMRNHTLMQTIARANRVYEGKESGIIVDYVGVFRDLQAALAIYGSGAGGGVREGDTPVAPKEAQIAELCAAIEAAKAHCAARGVDLEGTKGAKGLARLSKLKEGRDKLVHPADAKKRYLDLAGRVDRRYRGLGVDSRKRALAADWAVLVDLAAALRGLEKPVDVSDVIAAVERLLDVSVDAQLLKARETLDPYAGRVDLTGVDFEALARYFARTKLKATTLEVMTVAAERQVDTLVRLNPSRIDLRDRIAELISEYNAGIRGAPEFFQELLAFLKQLEGEARRAESEGLGEEALALYDLLLPAGVSLSAKERAAVKGIAKDLPGKLAKKLVIDWRKTQRARAAVRATVRDALDELPEAYDDEVYARVVEAVYEHVYESYWGEGKSKYSEGQGGSA